MRFKTRFTICAFALLPGVFGLLPGTSGLHAFAEDLIVSDMAAVAESPSGSDAENAPGSDASGAPADGSESGSTSADSGSSETGDSSADSGSGETGDSSADSGSGETGSVASPQTEEIALLETEISYEIPLGISDGLQKDTPVGEAARMTLVECEDMIAQMCEANSGRVLWGRHENVSAIFRLYDQDSEAWKEFSCSYADPNYYYSDDWSPGLEELRLLIYGENECVEDYTNSLRFVRFLNASGTPYRIAGAAPATLSEDTAEEMILKLHRTKDALYIITQLTETGILSFGLDEVKEESPGDFGDEQDSESPLFYSGLYVLDPDTLEVQVVRITAHYEDGTVQDKREIAYSYDLGMTEFVRTGFDELYRHITPAESWGPEYVRTVTVTLDPGTDTGKTYSVEALKGDAISISLPSDYELYEDEALTVRWVDIGDYTKDLSLWAAPPDRA